MYEFRKQFDETLRKEHLNALFLEKRKRLLGMGGGGESSSKFAQELRDAKNMIEETPEIYAHKIDYLSVLKFYEEAVEAFDKSTTPEDHTEILAKIAQKHWINQKSDVEHLTVAAFYNSGLPKYVLQFLKSGYRRNSKNLKLALTILSNAVIATLEQFEILVSMEMFDIVTELVTDAEAFTGSIFGTFVWFLANICGVGQEGTFRDIMLKHPRFLDEFLNSWDNRSVSQEDATILIWLSSNLLRKAYPNYHVGQRVFKRAIHLFFKYHSNLSIFEDGIFMIVNWLRGADEPTQRLRDFAGSGLWRIIRENVENVDDRTLKNIMTIITNITASNQEDIIASMIDLDLVELIFKWARRSNTHLQVEAMAILSNLLASSVVVSQKVSTTEVLNIIHEKIAGSYSGVRLEALNVLNAFLMAANEARLIAFLTSEHDVDSF